VLAPHRGFFTFNILIIKVRRLASAFLLIGTSLPHNIIAVGLIFPYSNTATGLKSSCCNTAAAPVFSYYNTAAAPVFSYCGTATALVFVFNATAKSSNTTTADSIIIRNGTAICISLFWTF